MNPSYDRIAASWKRYCAKLSRNESDALDDNEEVVSFLSGFASRNRAAARSALRAYAQSIGHRDPKSIGASVTLPRSPPATRKRIDDRGRDRIRDLITATMYSRTQSCAVLALVACGVHPSRLVKLRVAQIAESGEGRDRAYLVPSKIANKLVSISGVCARALRLQIEHARLHRQEFLIERGSGKTYARQSIHKMIQSIGALKIAGVDAHNLLGALQEQIVMAEEKPDFKSLDDVQKHVAQSMHKPVYNPETGKMRVLIGNGQYIDTEIHRDFVDELRKQGFNVTASEVKPSSKLEEAVGQVIGERIAASVKTATGMISLADSNADLAMSVLQQATTEAIRRVAGDPMALVDLLDTVMASIIVQRALVLSGQRTP